MTFSTLSAILHILAASIYTVVAFLTFRKRGFGDLVSRLLVVYLVFAFLWEGLQASYEYIYFTLALPESIELHLLYYGLFLLAFFFLALSIAFLRNEAPHWITWIFGSSCIDPWAD